MFKWFNQIQNNLLTFIDLSILNLFQLHDVTSNIKTKKKFNATSRDCTFLTTCLQFCSILMLLALPILLVMPIALF